MFPAEAILLSGEGPCSKGCGWVVPPGPSDMLLPADRGRENRLRRFDALFMTRGEVRRPFAGAIGILVSRSIVVSCFCCTWAERRGAAMQDLSRRKATVKLFAYPHGLLHQIKHVW